MARHSGTRSGWRRIARVGVLVLAGLLVVGGGGAYAAYRYEQGQADRILPGVRIAGLDVGGMDRVAALAAVEAAAAERLDRRIEVSVEGRTWRTTPAELGTTADVEAQVEQALALSRSMGWHERAFHRLLDRPVDAALDLRYERGGDGLQRFLRVIGEAVYASPSNARVELVDGELVVERPEFGLSLRKGASAAELRRAIRHEAESVELPVAKEVPKVGDDELGRTIVVRISEKKLYVYDGVEVEKTYPVATGQAGYPTPQGTWNIWDKRENPTWVNPAPDGWGRNLPAVIGPGPSNPLGTHALYLDAPGIRIHGTYDPDSIGTAASHGCIRMHIEDSEELFAMIDVGTQVLVLE